MIFGSIKEVFDIEICREILILGVGIRMGKKRVRHHLRWYVEYIRQVIVYTIIIGFKSFEQNSNGRFFIEEIVCSYAEIHSFIIGFYQTRRAEGGIFDKPTNLYSLKTTSSHIRCTTEKIPRSTAIVKRQRRIGTAILFDTLVDIRMIHLHTHQRELRSAIEP